MGTKLNPGTYDCYDKLAPDEVFFVLRAKDPIGPQTVRFWVNEAASAGHEPEKIMEASICADDMDSWRSAQQALSEAAHDQARLEKLGASLKLFSGHIEHADGMFRFVRTDGEGVVTAVSLRGLIEKMPKDDDDIPF